MAHVTLDDLTSDWRDETKGKENLMPSAHAVRNILAFSASTRVISTKRFGLFGTSLN